jgi:hypothetical protein
MDLSRTNELLEKLVDEISGLRQDLDSFAADLMGPGHFNLQDIASSIGAIESSLEGQDRS